MIALHMRIITISAFIFLLGTIFPKIVLSKNCSCPPKFCCSSAGYCGQTEPYCGDGCQSGPCYTTIAHIITQKFIDSILHHAPANCSGKSFYSRDAFLQSTVFDASFARTGEEDDVKRELAAFFAHFAYGTKHLCWVEENNGEADMDYCDNFNEVYPCVEGKKYYGRGPLQLKWQFNYALAGEALGNDSYNINNAIAGEDIGFDGLNHPEILAEDSLVSFTAAIWYWMFHAHPVLDKGFGATIRGLRCGFECDGANHLAVDDRIELYKEYCFEFGVDPGTNLQC